jgi:hypothetical protein
MTVYKPSDNVFSYDTEKWNWKEPVISNTVQVFITNRCNKRCVSCFYQDRLGPKEMSLPEYIDILGPYIESADKIILLGGEPTLHPRILEMIEFNKQHGLKTTIYTNGANLKQFSGFNMERVAIRLGVDGLTGTEKSITDVDTVDVPIHLNYMLSADNYTPIFDVADYVSNNFNCDIFFISRYRDTRDIQNYWNGTDVTLTSCRYAYLCEHFLQNYSGPIKELQFLRGGTFRGKKNFSDHCRFINLFPDQDPIICPLDICKHETTKEFYEFGSRPCQKFTECLLQKLRLERKNS